MYIVGIDPSLSSSALSIYKDGDLRVYNYNNKKENYKWFKVTNDIIDYSFHHYVIGSNFSESEVEKIKIYDNVTDNLVNTIMNEGEFDDAGT